MMASAAVSCKRGLGCRRFMPGAGIPFVAIRHEILLLQSGDRASARANDQDVATIRVTGK